MRRDRRLQLARRLQVSAYIPPASSVDVAQERTEDLVNYFICSTESIPANSYYAAIHTLARSCYLQGAHDIANQAAKMVLEGTLKNERSEGTVSST